MLRYDEALIAHALEVQLFLGVFVIEGLLVSVRRSARVLANVRARSRVTISR